MTPIVVSTLNLVKVAGSSNLAAIGFASRRLFSSGLMALQSGTSEVKEAANRGTFATFAEYREAIIKRDPVTMETRNSIMAPHEKKVAEPEGEKEEDQGFKDLAKKVAYH
ncbi:DEKNAAC104320 [Brettanomyces naardenensis]|uniref:DEKNAAC104320 n=1 Tax=Brettanomyces naardenensis TaxID=13370 RepID=A0A448YQJ8_BRENA|nr:DEKNAAC104320 [Brettanomyces naardenensis]